MSIRNNSIILRHNLLRLFDELADGQIIYVCAPAGFGKTVAVRQWLDNNIHAKAVISLDEYDNTPSQFCTRFCAALCSCQPSNTILTDIISHPAFYSAPDEFTTRAIAALSESKKTVFVIDDLHLISDERVLHLLLIFLKRLPETFQIILISRNTLPSALSELWMKGNIAHVTAKQLRFSSEEIRMLCKKRGSTITVERSRDIYRFTDGWAIGINAFLLSGGEPLAESLEYLEVFIQTDIWEKWDKNIREFMLNTAAARKLNPSLCTALTGISDSKKILNRLMQNGAFISQSGDGIYYYHHLFHNFLRNMLEERGERYLFSLLEKEGNWHLSQRDSYSAVECFIRCKNHDGIAKCFDMMAPTDRNDFVIERILSIVKNAEVRATAEKYPFLFSLMAWASFVEGYPEDMEGYLEQYYAKHPAIVEDYPGHVYFIFFMHIMDFRNSISDLGQKVTMLPVKSDIKTVPGSMTMNMPLIHRCTRDFSELAGKDTESAVKTLRDMIGWLFGEEIGTIAESLTAGLLYEQGHLKKAHLHALAANAEIKKHFAPEIKFCAISVLACILDALGQPDQADSVLKHLEIEIRQDGAYYLSHNLNALITRRRLWQGDRKAPKEWFFKHESALYDRLDLHGIYGTFTTCRAYIANGDYNLALILLKKVLELVKAYKRPLDIMEAQVLTAIVYWKKKRGFQGEAMRYLEDAVTTAHYFGFTQLFVNEGAELSGMLRRMQRRFEQKGTQAAVPVSFIKMLYLKTLDSPNRGLTSGQPEASIKYTEKQKTVMKLLCEGKTYKEIAGIMGIKLPTLRSHIALIYKKLDVTGEVDAIIKIRESGILEEI